MKPECFSIFRGLISSCWWHCCVFLSAAMLNMFLTYPWWISSVCSALSTVKTASLFLLCLRRSICGPCAGCEVCWNLPELLQSFFGDACTKFGQKKSTGSDTAYIKCIKCFLQKSLSSLICYSALRDESVHNAVLWKIKQLYRSDFALWKSREDQRGHLLFFYLHQPLYAGWI